MEPINDKFFELLAKELAGELTLAEKKELLNMLQDGNHQNLQQNLHSLLELPLQATGYLKESEMKNIVNDINSSIQKDNNKKLIHFNWFKITAVAASLIVLIFAALFYKANNSVIKENESVVEVKKGSKSYIELPDGSKVWLNSDTKLTYDKSFGTKARDVTLTGEAYFDVVKDQNRPFIVHTKTMDVKVLGTAFNVRAYSNEINTQTTLLRGSVEILLKKTSSEKIILRPKEKVIIQNSYASFDTIAKTVSKDVPVVALLKLETNSTDSSVAETKWISNQLVFDEENIETLIPILERWYNVKIVLKRNIPSNKRFTGTFENDKIEDVLETLKFFEHFNYSVEKGTIIIY